MSITQASLVQRIRFYLGDHPFETVGNALTSTSTVFVSDGAEWAKGDIGEFEDGDTFYVNGEVAGDELTCVRSYYGSTGAAHTDARLFKEPKYKFGEITNAISTVIQAYLPWPRIYKAEIHPVTPTPTTAAWYNLDEACLAPISCYQVDDASSTGVFDYYQRHGQLWVVFKRNLPASLVASGVGIRFPQGLFDPDNTVYFTCAEKVTDSLSSGSYDDLTDGEALTEAVILGTAQVLQRALELRKTRNSANEPDYIRSGRDFNSLFQTALNSAEKEIRAHIPLVKT